ncbi:MAG: bifunctional diaminohydroxyphosphoribosylaminopyrimidine deaminase/5-amino-6-(5-phosphoribosylamino)uracil reductase RibD [Gemmatimonadales bacterium]
MATDEAMDRAYLDRALGLADRGWGVTFPNPMVGAVVVRDGEIVGQGWHAGFGDAHAEVVALADAGDRARGTTLYVTLEPCRHFGKQPPCTSAIVAAGVARVVVASPDPDPIAGGGAAVLRAAGIVVEVGLQQARAAGRNFRFMHRFKSMDRPFVAIKLAVSMDGRIADAAGVSQWVSGDAARQWVQWLRAGFGAIGVGAATAIIDNARLTVRGALQPRLTPRRVIFDRRGTLPVDHVVFQEIGTAPVTVLIGNGVASERRRELAAAGADLVVADTLVEGLRALGEQGVDSVLVEGGGRLAGALLREKLVDRVYQIQSPLWLGDGKPAWGGLGSPAIDAVPRWRLNNVRILAEPGESGDVLIELEP